MNEKPTHLDLFSGIGGFSLAFEREGFQTIGFAEIDPYASAILRKHWPAVRNYGDVRNVPAGTWDVVTCGDPCQRNSNAWRNGSGKESPAIFALSLIENSQPRFVLRENPSRVRADAPWPWWRFRACLEDLGYAVLPVRLRACCAGLDHQRERMWLLAEFQNPNRTGLERDVREVVEDARSWRQNTDATGSTRRHPSPRICIGIDGIPNRVDRIRCLGNSIVPQVAQAFARAIRKTIESELHP